VRSVGAVEGDVGRADEIAELGVVEEIVELDVVEEISELGVVCVGSLGVGTDPALSSGDASLGLAPLLPWPAEADASAVISAGVVGARRAAVGRAGSGDANTGNGNPAAITRSKTAAAPERPTATSQRLARMPGIIGRSPQRWRSAVIGPCQDRAVSGAAQPLPASEIDSLVSAVFAGKAKRDGGHRRPMCRRQKKESRDLAVLSEHLGRMAEEGSVRDVTRRGVPGRQAGTRRASSMSTNKEGRAWPG
jgi:hypothetical protein